MQTPAAKKIVILGTGGTIAGTSAQPGDNTSYRAAQLGVSALLDTVPGLQTAVAGHAIEVEQLAQIDSKDMSQAVWLRLAQRVAYWAADPAVRGVVITHGTDTLEETAYFLHAVLAPVKPVVLACAMRPATALTPDGPQNLLDALATVMHPDARGVLAVCAGRVHGALQVRKLHPYRLDAFGSGEAGPLAVVEEGRLRLLQSWPPPASPCHTLMAALDSQSPWPRVEIVMSHAGADGAIVRALQNCAEGTSALRGLVVAGTGNGTLHEDLEAALLDAQRSGLRVWRSTRCAEGQVLPTPADRIPDSAGLSPVKARIALMLELLGAG
ncbi:MAG: asparaginase [Burkholderiaceae bacterium]|nr:asparaginase [Burkholderiaceae bacterium]MDO9088515.1 asparaginase [Burkholderiaceae bacterium]MDP1968715.1 asparaginase [Burkholderiaceae bacterium]